MKLRRISRRTNILKERPTSRDRKRKRSAPFLFYVHYGHIILNWWVLHKIERVFLFFCVRLFIKEASIMSDEKKHDVAEPATEGQEPKKPEPVTVTEEKEQEKPKKKSGRHLTPQEQLARIEEQQKQLRALARQIKAREDAKERKARAHRLIQIGGVVEAVYGDAIAGESMLNALENFLRKQDERGNYFSDALKSVETV